MEDKLDLIAEIQKFHPGYGVEKGYSKYVGGMADTGEWLYNVMIKESEENLKSFFEYLKECKKHSDDKFKERVRELKEVATWTKEKQDEFFRKEHEEYMNRLRKWNEDMECFLMWGKHRKDG